MITRRGLLRCAAGASVIGLAGCADPSAVLLLEKVNDAELAARVADEVEGTDEESVVRRAVENGTYTTTGDDSGLEPPVEERPVIYEGTYYDISMEATTVSEDRLYVLRVENVGETSVEGEIGYDELPDGDREAMSRVFEEEGSSQPGFEGGAEYPYTEDEYEASVLVDGATVVYEGSRYEVDGEQRRIIERNEFRYTADEVADSAEGFGAWARDEYGFVLEGLSEEERSVVEDSLDGGYYEGSTTEGFESLVGRFRDHKAVTMDEWRGEWVVEYEGTTYYAEMRYTPNVVED